MARSIPAHMPGSASVPFEPNEKPADRAGLQDGGEDVEYLHDVREPGWAPVSLALAAHHAAEAPDRAAVYLYPVPGYLAGDDVRALAALDARDHPGVTVPMEAMVVAAATARVRELGGSLTEPEMRAVLTLAGWPVELHDEALRVTWCESRWSPYARGDGGKSLGLFQLNVETWFPYAREAPEAWADPVVNARVAWATYQYDLGRGYEPWRQWSCKP